MKIADLSHLENASENELIVGGASGTITADASAAGYGATTITATALTLKAKKNGGAKLKGTGMALAIGEDPVADVNYDLQGFDKVKIKTIEKHGENFDYELVKIKAIDKPNK
ncbi:hypothetical protein [Scytonema sp. NUACC26]|uniref:hypothetical protein n=1 Tax=Scytonema sp. NUACC26 TaxID=3140176 RepID=UPI0034DB924C